MLKKKNVPVSNSRTALHIVEEGGTVHIHMNVVLNVSHLKYTISIFGLKVNITIKEKNARLQYLVTHFNADGCNCKHQSSFIASINHCLNSHYSYIQIFFFFDNPESRREIERDFSRDLINSMKTHTHIKVSIINAIN